LADAKQKDRRGEKQSVKKAVLFSDHLLDIIDSIEGDGSGHSASFRQR